MNFLFTLTFHQDFLRMCVLLSLVVPLKYLLTIRYLCSSLLDMFQFHPPLSSYWYFLGYETPPFSTTRMTCDYFLRFGGHPTKNWNLFDFQNSRASRFRGHLTHHPRAIWPRREKSPAFAADSKHLMAAAANGTVHIFRSPKEVHQLNWLMFV